MTAQWVEAAPITGTLRESGTWDGPTATLVDGVFTCDTPEVTTSSTINKDFIIPLPTGIDLSDETVIYRLKAEILEKSGGSASLISTMLACADPVGNVSESYSQLDFQYPVGTVMTLATSVQQQKYTNNAPPAGNYTRQLVRVMSGADPVVKFTASILSFGSAVTVPPAHYKVRLTLEKLEVAAAPPPAAVRYRDPADGQFKPLSQIAARGYPAAPSGPQPPAGPPLGSWDWTTTKQTVPGAASGAAVTNASGQGALYINAVDANGTDHTDALTAAAYDSPVTVVQGDVIVSGLIRSAYSITNGFQVRWTTVGPWALSAGPVDIWLAAP